jgi:valyl-tRNA synthetase
MSKSLGNVISPDQIIDGAKPESLQATLEESLKSGVLTKPEFQKSLAGQKKMFPQGIPACGVDALRFTLCSYNIKNHFINFDTAECHANRLFFNKIWQATRYTLACCEKLGQGMVEVDVTALQQSASEMDRWMLSRLGSTLRTVRVAMDQLNFHTATTALKTFFYANLCDVYLETTKLNTVNEARTTAATVNCQVLATCLRAGLDIMEPFTPFLAQELKRHLPAVSNFEADTLIDPQLEQKVERVMEVVLSVRQMKSQNQIVRKHEPVGECHSVCFRNK